MLHNFRRSRTPDVGVLACRDGEGLRETEAGFLVFVDVDAVGERLVREPFAVGVGALVEELAVDQKP
ncbi:hypothetical protein [Changpingibacter yushuensis]|uniref:hypothetical protein n=1 Tax=Changpingibacter yushuensis TaxID=2758440 RepID=UPI001CB6E004|nr:hypothetical protein [Changpingibacter yushuensis]